MIMMLANLLVQFFSLYTYSLFLVMSVQDLDLSKQLSENNLTKFGHFVKCQTLASDIFIDTLEEGGFFNK